MTVVTGYSIGVYDLFHVGHLRALTAARASCSRLVVGVLDDAAAGRRLGLRPFVPYAERMAVLASLECVDEVLSAADVDLRYDVFFRGTDRTAPVDPAALGSTAVVDLPAVSGTASPLLRSVLARAGGRTPVA